MSIPTPSELSPHFSHLIGRRVAFTKAVSSAPSKAQKVYGIYTSFPDEALVVVKADLPLLGSFAGSLMGLPDGEVRKRLLASEVDEFLRDATYEVMNVAAPVIGHGGRAVLKKVAMQLADIDDKAQDVLKKPAHSLEFDVAVADYQGGRFTVLF